MSSLKYKACTKADFKGKAVIEAIPQSQINYKTDCNVCLPFHGSVAFSGACAVCSLQVWGFAQLRFLPEPKPRELASDLVVTRAFNG